MRVMIRIDTATYAESVISTPMCAIGDPIGPIENGTTYIVRPFIDPAKSPSSFAFISAGAAQLLVGPASASSVVQMNVRSSTRATSPGSESARALFGRFASERRSKVPASTRSWHSRAYSSAEPSHHTTSSGWHRAAQRSTYSSSLALVVGAGMRPPTSLSGGRGRTGGQGHAGDRVVARRPHVHLGADAQARRKTLVVEGEEHALALAEHPEHRAGEGVRCELVLLEVGVAEHHAVARSWVVRLDHALHRSDSSEGTFGVRRGYRRVTSVGQLG